MCATSLTASQMSTMSIAEALAVGTKSDSPALEHDQIVACPSLVAQITNGGLLFDSTCPPFFSSRASQPA